MYNTLFLPFHDIDDKTKIKINFDNLDDKKHVVFNLFEGFDFSKFDNLFSDLEIKLRVLLTSDKEVISELKEEITNNNSLSSSEKKKLKKRLPNKVRDVQKENLCLYLGSDAMNYLSFQYKFFYVVKDFEVERAWKYYDCPLMAKEGMWDVENKKKNKALDDKIAEAQMNWANKAYASIREDIWDCMLDIQMMLLIKHLRGE